MTLEGNFIIKVIKSARIGRAVITLPLLLLTRLALLLRILRLGVLVILLGLLLVAALLATSLLPILAAV